jgi:hypothetical protein
MNTRLIIPLLIAGALAFACGPRSHSEPGAVSTASALTSIGAPRVTAKPAEHSRRSANAPKEPKLDAQLNVTVVANDVHLALNVSNVGGKYVELSFPNGRSHDFVVVDSSGRHVWQWSNGRMFTQGVQNKQLGAGDAMKLEGEWAKTAAPGRYTAIATLNSTNYPVERRIEFVVR